MTERADDGATPLLEGVCNMLYTMEGVRAPGAAITGAVMVVGNWVGGRFALYPDELRFTMNAMNARFQADASPRAIPLDKVRTVREGRMFWIAKTVDVETDRGLARFRCAPGGHRRLMTALQEMLVRRGGGAD